MPNTTDIAWFKTEFESTIVESLSGTPLSANMLVALACQETGEVWPLLQREGLPTTDVIRLCVGDTLDADRGRKAFPTDKADLLKWHDGEQMFRIAHEALVEMASHVPAYRGAADKPAKFCRGFGVFQRDLQFFKEDPDYFLLRRYEDFSNTLAHAVDELKRALLKLRLHNETSLTDLQAASVAICYNTGRYNPQKGLRQGYFDQVKFYGERYFDYLRLAQTIDGPAHLAVLSVPSPNTAILANPTKPSASGVVYRVDTRAGGMLNLRREPRISIPARANILTELPDGHLVRAVNTKASDGFREVEAVLAGAFFHGFCKSEFLFKEANVKDITAPGDAPAAPALPMAMLTLRTGRSVPRTEVANALSVTERGEPRRTGDSAGALRDSLNAIVDWLAVDDPCHLRYKPRAGLTFCNIYAHDYCHLAGVYLPRVWWTQKALLGIVAGQATAALIGNTVEEMRANSLFRWLRDFGQQFGWRQTGSLTKLQQAANQGGVALIIARRVQDGLSGHVTVVVPEGGVLTAKRDSAGEVTAPVQSQAGSSNFCRGRGREKWWLDENYAESAFWIHA
jgi:hypothetical protein